MNMIDLYDGNRYHFIQPEFHSIITQHLALAEKQQLLDIRDAGLGDDGYMKEFEGDHTIIFKLLIKVLRFLKDNSNSPLFEQFEYLPEQDQYFYSLVTDPFSLSELESNVNTGNYTTTKDFETDLFRVFDAFRLGSPVGSARYGNINILQRFYVGLFAPSNLTLSQDFNFASVKAGPGNPYAEELAEGVPGMEGVGPATSRILTRHRQFKDDGHYRGLHLNMGDWVHIINPDDATKPIPAQLFKVFTPDYSTHPHITVCRYYRPEQTVHAPYRRFYENEVFKSGNYVDLPIEDLLEKTFVMFATKYSRGRPKEHLWDKRRPLYIVEHRYSPKSKTEDAGGFSKIKSWNACIPEEVRKTEYEMHYFDESQRPPLLPSPFLRGIEGPGRLDENAPPPEEIGQHAVANASAIAQQIGSLVPGTPSALAQASQTGATTYKKRNHKEAINQQAQLVQTGQQNDKKSQYKAHKIQYEKPAVKRDKKEKKLKNLDRSITVNCKKRDIGQDGEVEFIPEETGECFTFIATRFDEIKASYFETDGDSNKLKWFSGPPLNMPKKGQTTYSPKYLLHRLSNEKPRKKKQKILEQDVDELKIAFDEFFDKNLEQPGKLSPGPRLSASEALINFSDSLSEVQN